MKYTVIIFYKYVHIAEPEKLLSEERARCERFGITGRTIIAHEGINATLEGTDEAVKLYEAELRKDPRFADVDIKSSPGTGNAFPRLSIKIRNEIVTLGAGVKDPKARGAYVDAQTLHEWYEQGQEFVVVDMRNGYEQIVGKFKGSKLMPIKNYRDIPKAVAEDPEVKSLKDKKVVTVCTSGVRCEKASGYLVEQGFKDVYQLHGGIQRYIQNYPAGAFEGSLYVFDGRILLSTASPEERGVVGRCALCQSPSEDYTNCDYEPCHSHFICCASCRASNGKAFCKDECRKAVSENLVAA